MATAWPEKRRVIGTRVRRLDGPAKATGKAKYSFDVNPQGLLQAVMLRCPHAHAKVKNIDLAAAEKMPGVKATFVVAKPGTELYYVGDEVLAIAADTEEHALDAARAVKVEYEVLPFLVKEEDALVGALYRKLLAESGIPPVPLLDPALADKQTVAPIGPKKERQNVRPSVTGKTEGFEEGARKAEVVVTGNYGMPVICHQCLESHGLVAAWDKEGGLTVWASTQAVTGTADELARYFSAQGIALPATKVKCITQYMGGGFGSKFGPDIQGKVAAELARKAGAPVKLMLDRAAEITAGGNRPSAYGTVTIGGTKDGRVTAFEVSTYGTPGIGNAPTVGPLPYVYPFENKRSHTIVRLNTGLQRAMRAPGHPQSCLFTDSALDDFAAKADLNPMAVRIKNLPLSDPAAVIDNPLSWNAVKYETYIQEIKIAARLSDWKKKWHKPGEGKGVVKHGIGMALHTWGGQAAPQLNECRVSIAQDGSVTAQTSTQDLGTAQRTVTAIVVAEILGLRPEQVTVQLGDSHYGASSGSGGSTTCPSQAPAALIAATAARDDFVGRIAKKLNAKPEEIVLEGGKVRAKKETLEWKRACALLGMEKAKGEGGWTFAKSQEEDNQGVSSVGVGGVQIAEVLVDTETGQVRCTKIVAVQDCGLVIDKMTCESQVAGGVIMGLNLALFEERIMDRVTGRQVNPDMEFYKLGGIEDMPEIVVHLHEMAERGVIGVGEPPTISTHAAIGNAVHNAIGVRVPHTPFTPERVLAALATQGGNKS
jgi:xanthine dehydrogenase YagR molybdenum-binding subunit